MATRIGPRIASVRSLVESRPGLPMIHYARLVGPHGSLQYGYASCHRAVKAGMVKAVQGQRRGTRVLLPVMEG